MASLSIRDVIMANLVSLGYTTGSIVDREYKRLLTQTGSTPVKNTLRDLYKKKVESPRLR